MNHTSGDHAAEDTRSAADYVSEPVRVAIDVGGTFTDVVTLVPSTGHMRFEKVPTTPNTPTRGVLDAFRYAQAPLESVAMFNHGTTLGVNCLLTRTGARTAIISTRGFRDVYLLGRTDRKPMYDIKYRKPKALLERSDTFEVTERSYFDGSIGTELDAADARAVAAEIVDRGYESVAVAFLHSYANPTHELKMREILREITGDIEVTLSHELSREYREYERTSTAVLDAYIKPIMRGYLHDLEGELADNHFSGRFFMSRSGGGAMTASTAREQPVNLILSGPAGGVVGAAAFSRLVNLPNLITIDMGGTSLDASLIVGGEPLLYQGAEFEGLPINTPSLNIQTIGAGGGSLVWLDPAGALQVGPQSAGAVPGPAAYARGGVEPTFTDAALVLGYLGSDTPLGGTLTLDAGLAKHALRPIAERMGVDLPELARGVMRISSAKIMGAVRGITVELGLDPKDFALLSFGGGGGLVAIEVARELGIPKVVVPPGSGAFSALGMLMADVQHDFARTAVMAVADADLGVVSAEFQSMEKTATQVLAEESFGPDDRRTRRMIDVRYTGQEHSVTLECPPGLEVGSPPRGFADELSRRFAEAHERHYGHVMTDPIEITTLRVHAAGIIAKPSLSEVEAGSGQVQVAGRRRVYLRDDGGEDYALYVREQLCGGDVIEGPAVVTEHTATTVMHTGDTLTVGRYGELIISVAARPDRVEQTNVEPAEVDQTEVHQEAN
ncbi:hydantoinase/oxoprolinase family protein [Homoserinimonas sp. OAct 916]|uniref:hydantoinase/oxoprolinase family protein n=1 Tax=Homoserinimonas sp. OAct 916 TaxID=2211450 RepID=UPI000DBE445C|nr:hydantoinase/oxoprolinase family protein [Homoserinimonas sp. OAct 916]